MVAISVLLALVVAAPIASGQSTSQSQNLGQLTAEWWNWAFSISPSPLEGSYEGGAQCNGEYVEGVFFLAGALGGSRVDRTCTMPAETQLFFPVVSAVAFPFFPGENKVNQREAAIGFIDAVENDPKLRMLVTVDGRKLESDQIVRATSPVFTLTLPEENVFDPFVKPNPPGVPAGEYKNASADGLWVSLEEELLLPGEHTIHFKINAPNVGFSQDNTYNLTVVN